MADKKIFLGAIGILLLIAIGVSLAFWSDRSEESSDYQDAEVFQPTEDAKFNTAPAKPEDNREIDKEKEEISKQTPAPSPSIDGSSQDEGDNDSKLAVNVTMTQVSQNSGGKPVEVRAFVTATSSGTCVVIFSKSGQSDIVRSGETRLQTSYYSCPVFSIDSATFPGKGEWQVKVNYSSTTEEGESRIDNILVK